MDKINSEKKCSIVKIVGGIVVTAIAYSAAYVAGDLLGRGIVSYLNTRETEDAMHMVVDEYQ